MKKNLGCEGSVFIVSKAIGVDGKIYAWKLHPDDITDEDAPDYIAYCGELVIRLKCELTNDEIFVLHPIHGPVWMKSKFLSIVKI